MVEACLVEGLVGEGGGTRRGRRESRAWTERRRGWFGCSSSCCRGVWFVSGVGGGGGVGKGVVVGRVR